MPIRGFIFDLDGVLTDTAEYHYRAWKRLADELGIPFTRRENEALRGISRRESLLLLLKGQAAREEQLQEWMELKNHYYLEFIHQINPGNLLPGARELLAEINLAGLKAGVASASKNAHEVIANLGIGDLLQTLSDGTSVEHQKPAPDLFLLTAGRLGLLPGECAVFEDAAAGVQAACSGGFITVGLGPPERVGEADLVLPSLEGVHLNSLLKALERFDGRAAPQG
jgi:beta-phosphoglucomutase